MKMSTKGRYGLRIMVELGQRYGQGPVTVDRISVRQEISGNYVHLLAGGLRSAGLLRSVRGPSGGYELTRDPSRITAYDVVTAIEGSMPFECVGASTKCSRASECAARDLWIEVDGAMSGVLRKHTLEDLAVRQQSLENRAPMFHI